MIKAEKQVKRLESLAVKETQKKSQENLEKVTKHAKEDLEEAKSKLARK